MFHPCVFQQNTGLQTFGKVDSEISLSLSVSSGCWWERPCRPLGASRLAMCSGVRWTVGTHPTAAASSWVSPFECLVFRKKKQGESTITSGTSCSNSLSIFSGKVSLDNVSERKDEMRLGMTLTSSPRDGSFVVSDMTREEDHMTKIREG